MRVATTHLQSVSAYSQSKAVSSERRERESHEEFELRTWKERAHQDPDGICFVPPTAFKNMLSQAAKFTSRKGPSGGKSTWTKNFEAGILVTEGLSLGVHIDDIVGEWLFVPPDGKPGGSRRVWKHFPLFPAWEGVLEWHVVDDLITEEIFLTYLREGGKFIGIGRFRPRNNGYYGRFKVVDISWSTELDS